MPFVIVLTESTLPTPDQLKRAFGAVTRFTEADAMKAAHDACGIVVKNLSLEEAHRLQHSLQADGVGVEVLEADQLPRLTDAKFLRRLEFQPNALLIHDPLGRSVPVPWDQISLLSAGSVRHFGITTERTESRNLGYSAVRGMHAKMETDVRHKVEIGAPYVIDLFVAGGTMRFQIEADSFPFKYCFDHPDLNTAQKVALLVQMLAQHAPRAALNRGAAALLNNDFGNAAYPSKAALFDESIWLLWRAARNRSDL
jgi:hypothetical protein